MKKSGFIAVSAAAASATVAASGYSIDPKFKMPDQEVSSSSSSSSSRDDSSSGKSASSDKFAPRYDGLRFIETLVTGHR
ncbi:hypothetical protein MLD38_003096 [Melastoma candidum]|uniref:Uncharacterized protein n=1 Tax=Melastoma candidum TaxID=119954 RepID=A0ACB9S5A8_9MYRT|nr:hypothetical protein MLD38_003096 [Melastoma candidum]